MKKKSKRIFAFLLIGCMIATSSISSYALQMDDNTIAVAIVNQNLEFDKSSLLEDVGEVHYEKAINVDGDLVYMYPTFKDPQQALETIGKRCSGILQNMKTLYEIEPFSKYTAEEYQERLREYENFVYESYENGEIPDKILLTIKETLPKLYSFFDIYENERKNNDIIRQIYGNGNVTNVKKVDFSDLRCLEPLLPYNTGGYEKIEAIEEALFGEIVSVMAYSGNSSFSVTDGVEYAVAHATTPNIVEYSTKSADCTNFTSQIKKAGGVPVYKTSADADGWNYKNTYTGSGFMHTTYSARWVNADKFAKFFGVKSTYSAKNYSTNKGTAFINFAAAVKKGSFIAYDEEGDGDWNHNAFVTYLWHSGESARRAISYDIDNNSSTNNSSTYKDFKIAQHTRNYHKWVSSNGDTGCGWEDLPFDHPNVVFAIVN